MKHAPCMHTTSSLHLSVNQYTIAKPYSALPLLLRNKQVEIKRLAFIRSCNFML